MMCNRRRGKQAKKAVMAVCTLRAEKNKKIQRFFSDCDGNCSCPTLRQMNHQPHPLIPFRSRQGSCPDLQLTKWSFPHCRGVLEPQAYLGKWGWDRQAQLRRSMRLTLEPYMPIVIAESIFEPNFEAPIRKLSRMTSA